MLSLEYSPTIRNLTVLPLHLSPDVDNHLAQITEGRVPIFAAEIVPDYLRTKPDPSAETRMNLHEAKANAITNEAAAKQVAQYNKIVSHVYDLISKSRDEWEMEMMHRNVRSETCNQNDTQTLVKAIALGIGLKTGSPAMMMQQPGARGVPMSNVSPMPQQMQMGKMPSSIKTNIKSAQLHPYR